MIRTLLCLILWFQLNNNYVSSWHALKDVAVSKQGIPTMVLNGTRFFIVRMVRPWPEARDTCKKFASSRMASAQTKEEAQTLIRAVQHISTPFTKAYNFAVKKYEFGMDRRYWIGLHFERKKWGWADTGGKNLMYDELWFPNQPDHLKTEHCGSLWNPTYHQNRTHSFNNDQCGKKYYFICEQIEGGHPAYIRVKGGSPNQPGPGKTKGVNANGGEIFSNEASVIRSANPNVQKSARNMKTEKKGKSATTKTTPKPPKSKGSTKNPKHKSSKSTTPKDIFSDAFNNMASVTVPNEDDTMKGIFTELQFLGDKDKADVLKYMGDSQGGKNETSTPGKDLSESIQNEAKLAITITTEVPPSETITKPPIIHSTPQINRTSTVTPKPTTPNSKPSKTTKNHPEKSTTPAPASTIPSSFSGFSDDAFFSGAISQIDSVTVASEDDIMKSLVNELPFLEGQDKADLIKFIADNQDGNNRTTTTTESTVG